MTDQRKLQIFVSSTYTDLLTERQTAVSAILKAGHIPAGMELFTSGDKSQLDVIKQWIDQSDVYMLILGTRYGSIEPESKLSYTEVEYDHAISTGKPLFALVLSDAAMSAKLKKSGTKFLEKDHPENLKSFREKVMSKMCSICDDDRDIKSAVYENLIGLSQRPELEGWVRGGLATDTRPLLDQIVELTATNDRLKLELSELRQRQTSEGSSAKNDVEFSALEKVLNIIKIRIPESISEGGTSIDTTAFRMFVLNRNLYARGVSVGPSSTDRAKWFEKNLYGPLMTHRILQMERSHVSRTYTITERGLDFAAWLDMKALPPG